MLNRHLLRIKAMQSLYSYFTAKESLLHVERQGLEKTFTPDPAYDDLSDTAEKDKHRHQALRLYDAHVLPDNLREAKGEISEVVLQHTADAIRHYHNDLSAEGRQIREQMLESTRRLQQDYYRFLLLPGEFQFIEKVYLGKKESAYIHNKKEGYSNLQRNPIVEAINTYPPLQKEVTSHKISWQTDHEVLRTWYKDLLRKDEKFREYESLESPSLEDHRAFLIYFYKWILTRNPTTMTYWEEQDMKWQENGHILRSMLVKTIQLYDTEAEDPLSLRAISINEEDD
jgi:N utilization substance protein B